MFRSALCLCSVSYELTHLFRRAKQTKTKQNKFIQKQVAYNNGEDVGENENTC